MTGWLKSVPIIAVRTAPSGVVQPRHNPARSWPTAAPRGRAGRAALFPGAPTRASGRAAGTWSSAAATSASGTRRSSSRTPSNRSAKSRTAASPADIACAYVAARDAFALRPIWRAIEALDLEVEGAFPGTASRG